MKIVVQHDEKHRETAVLKHSRFSCLGLLQLRITLIVLPFTPMPRSRSCIGQAAVAHRPYSDLSLIADGTYRPDKIHLGGRGTPNGIIIVTRFLSVLTCPHNHIIFVCFSLKVFCIFLKVSFHFVIHYYCCFVCCYSDNM